MNNELNIHEELNRLRVENIELRKKKSLSDLIESGFEIILKYDDTESIFTHFFDVLHQAMRFDLGLLVSQVDEDSPWVNVSATDDVSEEFITNLQKTINFKKRRENIFNLYMIDGWQTSNSDNHSHAELHSLIGVQFISGNTTYMLLLLHNAIGNYSQSELDMLESFVLFANNTILQFERRELIRQRRVLEARQSTIEKTLIQSEKMASLGQMAAGVAHEINNPMSYIVSNLDNLEFNLAEIYQFILQRQPSSGNQSPDPANDSSWDTLREDTQDIIDEMREGASRIKNIVQGLRQFAHPDQSQVCTVNINELIESTLRIAWNQIKYKAKLDFVAGEETLLVTARPSQLSQVLINVFMNAAQAIEGSNGLIQVRTYLDNDFCAIDITDNGCGIRESDLSSIFNPFYTTKPVGTGTGLGLAISKSIIEQHHGFMNVKSKVDIGTTFTIKLPKTNCDDTTTLRPSRPSDEDRFF